MYVVEGWKYIPILLTSEQMLFCGIANNLTKVIMTSLLHNGGFYDTHLVLKLISFGANGCVSFSRG